jgi:hypothetical protein
MNARRINIRRGDLVCIRNGDGVTVAVERGTAWLTQDGDHRDVVLEAGGSFRLDREGVAVVAALAAAELTVTGAAGASLRVAIATPSHAPGPFAGAGRFAHGF